MRYFNAFQFVVFMIALPSIIAWLSTSPFSYSLALKWLGIVCLVCQSIYTIVWIGDSFETGKR